MVAQSNIFTRLHQYLCPSFTNVRVVSQPSSNRSLTIVDPAPAGTTLLSIPREKTITTSAALQHPLIQQILTSHPAPPPTTRESAALLLYIIIQSTSTEYKLWFDTLPTRIDTATTVRSVNALLSTPLYPLADTLRHELHALYNDWYIPITNTHQQLPSGRDIFLYAHAIIESRAFLHNGETVITPLLDFCNHSPDPNGKVITTDTTINLLTTRDIKPGEQLTICYGELSNQELLLHWGFALDENPYDELAVSIDQPEDVPKMVILAVCVSSMEFSMSVNDPLPEDLKKAVRILSLGEGETSGGVRRDYSEIVSYEGEGRALEMLRGVVESLDVDGEVDGVDGVEEEFDKFCGVYRKGIVRILDAARRKIVEMEERLEETQR